MKLISPPAGVAVTSGLLACVLAAAGLSGFTAEGVAVHSAAPMGVAQTPAGFATTPKKTIVNVRDLAAASKATGGHSSSTGGTSNTTFTYRSAVPSAGVILSTANSMPQRNPAYQLIDGNHYLLPTSNTRTALVSYTRYP